MKINPLKWLGVGFLAIGVAHSIKADDILANVVALLFIIAGSLALSIELDEG